VTRTVAVSFVLSAVCALISPVFARQGPAPTLTLEEAIDLARRNNPDYLAQRNNATSADWSVREAYGALLPGANASTSLSWQGAGTQRFGIFTGEDFGLGNSTTDYYSSSYSLGLNYRLSGSSLIAPGREKANRRAVEATIEATEFTLDANVTRGYLAVLRAQDGVTLARSELARAEENLKYAQARVQVGAAIPMETKQAEVERGRARVALLQAENLVRTERLRLMQTLGVQFDGEMLLTSQFRVNDIPWSQDDLVTYAIEAHPQIRAARASENATDAGVKMARSAYLPSMSVQAGWSGFARQAGNDNYLVQQARDQIANQRESCLLFNRISGGLSTPLPGRPSDCSAIALTPAQEASIRNSNDVFPFDFSREPLSVSLTFSLPIFQGFTRERQIEEAKVAASDASLRVRSEEMRIRTDVSTAYLNAVTARQTVDLEETNRTLADDQLRLARERYRVGAASFLELHDAETVKARADRAYLTALYSFHESLAALEAAVGRPLRTTVEGR
jgi:outer membrane protein